MFDTSNGDYPTLVLNHVPQFQGLARLGQGFKCQGSGPSNGSGHGAAQCFKRARTHGGPGHNQIGWATGLPNVSNPWPKPYPILEWTVQSGLKTMRHVGLRPIGPRANHFGP
ncbi:hypothetical protein ACE6H2_026191 [Prunus campanulata]